MGVRHHFSAQLLVVLALYFRHNFFGSGNAYCPDKCQVGSCNAGVGPVGSSHPNTIGCLHCSHEYLTASYFDSYNSPLDTDFHDFLAQKIDSSDLCNELGSNINMFGLSDLNRHLSGEGSHRRLVSTMRFNMQSDVLSWLDDHFCEAIIIERLPIGVFADPFELQHLVHRRVFLGAAVFGDTNLELPSALSNRSITEIRMDIGRNAETVVQLPLHARYPPLDAGGYARVTIGRPDLFLRCRTKDLQSDNCSWTIRDLGAGCVNSVMWQIPCGNEALAGVVSGVTFISALLCSLLIVFSAVCFSSKDDIKSA